MNIKDISKYVNSLSILYVEDHDETKRETLATLEFYSPNISTVSNGQEAYELFCKKHIDLIFTDIEMPQLNGIKLIRKIREKNILIPIIIFTAHTKVDYLKDCVNLNIQAYIEKPINSLKLQDAFIKTIDYLELNRKEEIILNQFLSYDMQNGVLLHQELEVRLNKKEKSLLDLLILYKNNVVTYEVIEYEVWEKNDEIMTSTALRTVIKNLRKKIEFNLIENISGLGYKLII